MTGMERMRDNEIPAKAGIYGDDIIHKILAFSGVSELNRTCHYLKGRGDNVIYFGPSSDAK